VTADGTTTFELSDLRGVLEATTLADVRGVLADVEAATRRGWTAAGFVAYDAAAAFDPAFAVPCGPPAPVGTDLPLAWFGLFARSRPAPPLPTTAPAGAPQRPGPGPSDATPWPPDPGGPGGTTWIPEMGAGDHGRAVGAIREAIAAGDTYLTNLTTRFRRPWLPTEDPFDLYRRLVSGHAGGLHTFLDTDAWAVACGSPELFFDLRAGRLTTRPMKGTARRGGWDEEDRYLAEALRTSPKERAENVMVVDMLRNDLGRLAVPGTVEVPDLGRLEGHPTVWQLTSTVTATARPGTGLGDVFAALFPCASVTGAPKVAAMRLLAGLERSGRGVYCGAVGIVRPGAPGDGPDARFAVAIRTAVVDKGRRVVEYGSGGGVTWDSVPEAEWEELLIKLRVIDPQGPAAALLETMGFDPAAAATDSGLRNLSRHLDRLAASAASFGYPPPGEVRVRLAEAVRGQDRPARVRLLLHSDATVEIELHPLDGGSDPDGPVTLCVDDQPVDPSDPGLFHKTTDRRRYDERSARHPGADDVVLVNRRHEVTETTRANLVVRFGDRWYTPPRRSGLLPGVERARLLDEGVITERVVTVEELHRADAVATVSSLRGWREASVRAVCACRPTGSDG
jgi:para-aminobenzoate synthetase/4-amino-4-deoxychorismate lyase